METSLNFVGSKWGETSINFVGSKWGETRITFLGSKMRETRKISWENVFSGGNSLFFAKAIHKFAGNESRLLRQQKSPLSRGAARRKWALQLTRSSQNTGSRISHRGTHG